MRIKHIHILGEYKNLKDFKLDFEGNNFIDVFVGKNGTGKSNLFEAIIEIFKHLYEKEYIIYFNYHIVYEINETPIDIKWEKERLLVNGKPVKNINKKMLPDNILIYYSGHNSKIKELVYQYEEKFKKELKEANEGDTREFIGIGKEYKALLLAVLLLQGKNNKAKNFICNKLGIKEIGHEVKIVLKRPNYARKKGYEVDRQKIETSFWKAAGITGEFLENFLTIKKGDSKGRVREEGYFERDGYLDEYIFYFDIIDFNRVIGESGADKLFRDFDNLKTIEMLSEISIDLLLENGSTATINNFSDGQFQTVYIYSIIEIFKNRNCITLLDEPDSFLHPEWQFDFFKQIFEITGDATKTNHVLMSSHSASTITSINEGFLNLFEINENRVVVNKMPKSDIIKSLSSGLISFSEIEAKLNINHFLNNTSGAVLFTEGITDEMILETAWNKLYPGTKPIFEIQNAYSCSFLRVLITDKTLYTRFPNKKFFALFDFDEAYVHWNQLGADIETNPYKCLTKKWGPFDSYSILLPVPNSQISKQVLNDKTGSNYKNRSLLTIEHLFYDAPGLSKYFTVDPERTDGFIKFISDGHKVKFAEEVVPKVEAKYFESFKPIFEFIINKCK